MVAVVAARRLSVLAAGAVALAVPTPVLAQAPALDDAVDFTITLRDLDRLVRQGQFEPPPRALVLDGTIKRITIFDPNPATFDAEIELVKGEWFEREAVRSYRSIIVLQGGRFASLFPPRGVEPTRAAIPLNSRVMVAGVALGVAPMSDDPNDLSWVVQGFHVRQL